MSYIRPTKITVERIRSNDEATVSVIYVDGKAVCFGLEDEYREEKVPEETRIPAGVYDVRLRNVGGFDGRYRKKFAGFHRGMLHIQDVPNFKYVLIHIGNTDKNTAGCLLVGAGAMMSSDYTVQSSTYAYKDFYGRVVDAAEADVLTIEFVDRDR